MIIGACLLAVAVFSTVFICNVNKGAATDTSTNNSLSDGNSGNVFYSETRYNQDELINNSELIVKCVFTGEKETKKVTALSKNGRGEDMKVKGAITTYKMKTVESLKGSVNDEFEFGLMGTGDNNFKKDGEYVLFLNYNSYNNTYRLVSYSQGFNRIKQKSTASKSSDIESDASNKTVSQDETTEIESVDTNEVINYKDLKNKIKELEK